MQGLCDVWASSAVQTCASWNHERLFSEYGLSDRVFVGYVKRTRHSSRPLRGGNTATESRATLPRERAVILEYAPRGPDQPRRLERPAIFLVR
jgi:hypothetical protein